MTATNIAYLPITKGYLAIVDLDDIPLLINYTWWVTDKGAKKRYSRYVRARHIPGNKQKYILMHRLITGAKEGELVDHINGDTLDNRRSNLRICNAVENARNRSNTKNSKSGYKGVNSSRKRWKVEIGYMGKLKYYGTFKEREDAATVYNFAVKDLFGEFASYNEVPQPWLEGTTSE